MIITINTDIRYSDEVVISASIININVGISIRIMRKSWPQIFADEVVRIVTIQIFPGFETAHLKTLTFSSSETNQDNHYCDDDDCDDHVRGLILNKCIKMHLLFLRVTTKTTFLNLIISSPSYHLHNLNI